MPGPTIARAVSTLYGDPVPERPGAVGVVAGTRPTLSWTLADPRGAAVDLTPLAAVPPGGGPAVVAAAVRAVEASASSAGGPVTAFAASVADPATGGVSAAIDPDALGGPGVYRAQVAALDPATGLPGVWNDLFLYVERGPFALTAAGPGPPRRSDVRQAMRDSSPVEQRLLDGRQWDDADIALAAVRAIDRWNSAPPPGFGQTTRDFPDEGPWLNSICGELWRVAAAWFRQNRLSYNAGGLAVDDLDKDQACDARGDQLLAEYDAWIKATKRARNMAAAWGSIPSPYAWAYGRPRY